MVEVAAVSQSSSPTESMSIAVIGPFQNGKTLMVGNLVTQLGVKSSNDEIKKFTPSNP